MAIGRKTDGSYYERGKVTDKYANNLIYNVLVMDDNPEGALLESFAERGIHATVVKNKKTACKLLDQGKFNIVFVSSCFDGFGGPREPSVTLCEITSGHPEMPVVVLGEEDSALAGTRAIRGGFADYLAKPVDRIALGKIISKYMPNHHAPVIASVSHQLKTIYHIVGAGSELAKTVELAKKIAVTSTPVLISGESGTGKELIAHLIHTQSKRVNGPYIRVNCASLSESLIESELFGHEKGAFTGAGSMRKGRFERAHGGTLLLDEITETPVAFQSQLLRALEEQDIERVGGNETINVNVRVISTTNRDILSEVHKGNFRADLYYRLAGIRLVVPPLKQRREDIVPLVWHFINQLSPEANRSIERLDPLMIEVFCKYEWPGNVRQLRNVVRTSLILGTGSVLTLAEVSWLLDELNVRPAAESSKLGEFLGSMSLAEIERHAIVATLEQTDGNQVKAAKVLGISDRTIREKVKQYRKNESLLTAR
jgi:two-component system response regulator AtoC